MIRKLFAKVLRKWAQRLDGPIQVTVHLHLDGKQITEASVPTEYERTIAMRAMRQ